MSANATGFNLRQLAGVKEWLSLGGTVAFNPGKVLPATTTGNLFTVSGAVVVNCLIGVVTTVFSVTAVKPTIGITGANAAIAAAPAVAYNGTAVGSLVQLPRALGGALPAAVTAQGAAAGMAEFIVGGSTNITITTDATNTGAISWVLIYQPLRDKAPGSVTAV